MDTQVRIDKKILGLIKRLASKFSKRDGFHWSIKNVITYLVRTHPEIAKQNDDKEL